MTETIKEKLKQQQQNLDTMNKILIQYPDIKENTDRWGNVRFYSSKVNAIADQVSFSHSCGCCLDAWLDAYPYIEIDDIKIYSDPLRFGIGRKIGYDDDDDDYCEGYRTDRPDINWEDDLEKSNISQIIIDKIQQFFENQKVEKGKE